jgi:hypothetical protein
MKIQRDESPLFELEHSPNAVNNVEPQEAYLQTGLDEADPAHTEAMPVKESAIVNPKPASIHNQQPLHNPKRRNGECIDHLPYPS